MIPIHLKRLDWPIIICSVLLIVIGLLALYSSSVGQADFLNFKKQIVFALAGIGLIFLVSLIDWRILRNQPYLITILYVIGCLSLVGLFFFAPEVRAVKGWYRIGPLSIDPVEFTKIVLVLLLAKYFSVRHVEVYRIRHILYSGLYILVPSVLLFFQPNMGQVLILVALWLVILLVSGIRIRTFSVIILILLMFLALGWSVILKDYQKERIASFVLPQFEPLGVGWSRDQAQIAIGSGGLLGQGFMQGSQTQYGFLPEAQTDFIFSAIAEESGLLGISVVFILFLIIIWRIIKISIKSQTNFPRLFTVGFVILLFSQIFIHIGMNLGILPIIGLPLPLVSYGGSNLLLTCIGLGIVQSIKSH
ncbi:MAG: FtsW/RodA/SpoVE family cell cycle protein [Candidatus Nealsonbacteria bacterium]